MIASFVPIFRIRNLDWRGKISCRFPLKRFSFIKSAIKEKHLHRPRRISNGNSTPVQPGIDIRLIRIAQLNKMSSREIIYKCINETALTVNST